MLPPRPSALANWLVNDQGACERVWSPDELLRGPEAILIAPVLPFEGVALGVERFPVLTRDLGFPVAVVIPLGWGVAGGAEAVAWLGTGIADTVTGGYFGLAPADETDEFLRPFKKTTDSDHCGRPLSALPPRRMPGASPPGVLRY